MKKKFFIIIVPIAVILVVIALFIVKKHSSYKAETMADTQAATAKYGAMLDDAIVKGSDIQTAGNLSVDQGKLQLILVSKVYPLYSQYLDNSKNYLISKKAVDPAFYQKTETCAYIADKFITDIIEPLTTTSANQDIKDNLKEIGKQYKIAISKDCTDISDYIATSIIISNYQPEQYLEDLGIQFPKDFKTGAQLYLQLAAQNIAQKTEDMPPIDANDPKLEEQVGGIFKSSFRSAQRQMTTLFILKLLATAMTYSQGAGVNFNLPETCQICFSDSFKQLKNSSLDELTDKLKDASDSDLNEEKDKQEYSALLQILSYITKPPSFSAWPKNGGIKMVYRRYTKSEREQSLIVDQDIDYIMRVEVRVGQTINQTKEAFGVSIKAPYLKW